MDSSKPPFIFKAFQLKIKSKSQLFFIKSSLKNYSFNHCLFLVIPKLSDTNKLQVVTRIQKLESEEQDNIFDHRKRYRLPKINEVLTALLNEYKYNLDTIDKSKMAKLGYF